MMTLRYFLVETALHELNEKKKYLQERLESNLNDLQQAQEQASIQPDSIRGKNVP